MHPKSRQFTGTVKMLLLQLLCSEILVFAVSATSETDPKSLQIRACAQVPCKTHLFAPAVPPITKKSPKWCQAEPQQGSQIHPKSIKIHTCTPRCPKEWPWGTPAPRKGAPRHQNRASQISVLDTKIGAKTTKKLRKPDPRGPILSRKQSTNL